MPLPSPDDPRMAVRKAECHGPVLSEKVLPIFSEQFGEETPLVQVLLDVTDSKTINQSDAPLGVVGIKESPIPESVGNTFRC